MPTFRGFVLGLRRDDVRRVLEAGALPAKFRSLPPPLSLMLGLSRDHVLRRTTTPTVRRMAWRFLLFGFWSVVTVIFLGTVAAFLLPVSGDLRIILVLASLALGFASLIATSWYWTRVVNGDTDTSDLGAAADLPWDVFLLVPEAGVAALGIALALIFFTFILFAVWLPLVFVALNALTLGELWRRYRLVLVELPEDRPERVAWVGMELLRRGGVLSRSWDSRLDPADLVPARRLREAHGRIERRLILVGMASLFLAGLILVRRYFPPEAWDPIIYAAAAFTGLALFVLMVALFRARASRTASA